MFERVLVAMAPSPATEAQGRGPLPGLVRGHSRQVVRTASAPALLAPGPEEA